MPNDGTIQAKCQRCGHEWTTLSDRVYLTCPSCQSKVRIRELSDDA